MDSYGLSKVVNEKTARAFAMRTGADIYALRIGNVIEPHDYDRFPRFLADPVAQAQRLELYRRPRSGPDRPSLPAEGRAGLSGLQRGQRHHHRRPADRGIPGGIAPTRRSPARWAAEAPLRTARRARCWAFARRTTGAARWPAAEARGGCLSPAPEARFSLPERGAVCSPPRQRRDFFQEGGCLPPRQRRYSFQEGGCLPPTPEAQLLCKRGTVCPPRRARGPPPPEDIFGQKVMPRFACMRAGRGVAAMHRGAGGPRGVAPRG